MDRDWRDRIISNPDILLGKPTIKGTRISVELILGCLGSGWSFADILESYPHITREDILAALAYSQHLASARRLLTPVPRAKPANASEVQFMIEQNKNGGYFAKAIGVDIFTEADDLPGLRLQVRDAVRCHFSEEKLPGSIRLFITQEEILSV